MSNLAKSILQKINENSKGQFDSILREGMKDIQQTFHETVTGKSMHAPEMGTPLNPTPHVITESMGKFVDKKTDSIADTKDVGTVHGAQQTPETQAKETIHGKQAEQPEQMSTLDKLRGYAKEKAQEAEQQMEKQNERGGMEM
jgi:hypothetical protein